jgi:hypothetical protein
MTDFIAAILEIEKQYGPGRLLASLGGMSILNAIKKEIKYCHNYRKWEYSSKYY